ncbi:PD-(D/E)XK motif protein [Rubellimicrobium rubrum]|uniref:PD-(D/E)XK motif protein n=2 Tax=Rubellimicrobium rubrum TaxID=2585369 RepID=A0A5C4MKC4_9RHOB|nr:PD-(D/E)XK motif protein [Rubellimicrobium rubrum]
MWNALGAVAPGERLYRTRRLGPRSRLDLRVGYRETDGAPCLVVVADGVDTSSITAFETGGLRLGRARDETGTLLVLSLEEPGRRDLFAQVCADLIRSVPGDGLASADEIVRALAERLGAWRAFLRDRTGAMQRHEIVGIAGELVVLARLCEAGPETLGCWRSPDDGLHDFERNGWALEVKTSLGPGGRLHVYSLDQLDDDGLAELHVAHVRLAEDPAGAGVVALAAGAERLLPTERSRRELRNALLRRGLSPEADDTFGPAMRVLGIDYYRVRGTFPRLRRRDVPAGVVEASYQLETRSLVPHAETEAEALVGVTR